MTLTETIRVLEKEKEDHHSFSTDVIGKAEQIGIEALKAYQLARKEYGFRGPLLLPGETED